MNYSKHIGIAKAAIISTTALFLSLAAMGQGLFGGDVIDDVRALNAAPAAPPASPLEIACRSPVRTNLSRSTLQDRPSLLAEAPDSHRPGFRMLRAQA